MSIKHLYPNSTPALNLNFKSSRVVDPRITTTRASTATYVDPVSGLIKTAPANVARVGKDGLLIEESRTNEQKNSADFANNSSWIMKNSYTRGSNTTEPAPDGTNTACEFFEVNGAGSFNGVRASPMYQITASSGRLTVSVFNKPINNDTFMIMPSDTGSAVANCTSIINNTWSYNSSFVESATSEPAGNGWYRFSATFIVYTSTQWYRPVFSSQMFGGPNETPDATQGCTLWGAQVETASFPTSYIPTAGATVTRAADTCQITGSNFDFFNESEFTLVSDTYNSHAYGTAASNGYLAMIQSNTTNYHSFVVHGSTIIAGSNSYYKARTGSTNQYMRNSSASENLKAAWGIGPTSAEAHNGSTQTMTLSSNTGMPVCTEMSIGVSLPVSANAIWFNGTIRSLSLYATRVPNAALESLTQ